MFLPTLVNLLLIGGTACGVIENPLSDEFIDNINRAQISWTAGRNFKVNTPIHQIQALLTTTPKTNSKLPKVVKHILKDLPTNFDSRDNWPNCKTLNEVPDQASCASGWAVAAVGAITDRICITSNATIKTSLSANDLMSCCTECGKGCNGGNAEAAWKYWLENGIVSGGVYGVFSGCQAYPFSPCDHYEKGLYPSCGKTEKTPECTKKCDVNSELVYKNDLHFADIIYNVYNDEQNIRTEIYQHGPVEATFDVYNDFVHYKTGVYKHTKGKQIGTQSVKILGWGEENGNPYWLAVNSWNEYWGDKGFFKILRGSNECGIESNMAGGRPALSSF